MAIILAGQPVTVAGWNRGAMVMQDKSCVS